MKKLTVPIEILECEVCGFRASHVMQMEHHEKTHLQDTCLHTNLHYSIDKNNDYDGITVKIECKCKDCLMTVNVDLPEYDQAELAKIFEATGGMKLMHERKVKIQKAKDVWAEMQSQFEAKYNRKMTDLEIHMFKPQPL